MNQDIITQVSLETGLSNKVVSYVYNSFWKFIRDKISELPLKEDIEEREFKELRTSFNIPSIGKLSCDYYKYLYKKRKYKKSREC